MIADAGRYLLLSLLSSFRCIRDMNNKFWACEQCPARNGHTTAPAETTVGVWYQSVLLLIRTRSSWRPVVFVQVLYNKPRHLSSIPVRVCDTHMILKDAMLSKRPASTDASRLPYTALKKHVHGLLSVSISHRCIARFQKHFDKYLMPGRLLKRSTSRRQGIGDIFVVSLGINLYYTQGLLWT